MQSPMTGGNFQATVVAWQPPPPPPQVAPDLIQGATLVLTWPSGLPLSPQNGQWTETPQRNIASFQPEVGPPKYRRRNTANGTRAQAVFMMSSAQVVIFDAFYGSALVDGTLPFTWAHPITGVVYSWIFESEPEKNAAYFDWNRVSVSLRRLP